MTLPTLPPEHVVMLGLTGSRLYGLNHAQSDYDWKGVYVADLREVLSIGGPRDNYTIKEPDSQFYEVGRFLQLLLKSNPTVLEMLFLPEYEIAMGAWEEIYEYRTSFLSQKVRTVYYGFGVGQLKLFRSGKGDAKAARHFYRVMEQGEGILRDGIVRPRPSDPSLITEKGAWAAANPEAFLADAEGLLAHFDTIPSDLRPEVDSNLVDDMLFHIRMHLSP